MEQTRFKSPHIFWGVLLITLGGLFLLNNFTTVNLNWSLLLKLWPVVIILWGLSLLLKNNIGKAFMAGMIALILAFSIYAGFRTAFAFANDGFTFDFHDEEGYWDEGAADNKEFVEPMDSSITHARFRLNAGAGSFWIDSSSADLFSAQITGGNVMYDMSKNGSANSTEILLNMKKQKIRFGKGKNSNKVKIALNETPAWDMDLDVGAAAIDFDLSPYNVSNLTLETGAASVKLKLGERAERADIKINAGASSLEILLPASVGCEIRTDVALSSRDFAGFTRMNDDYYVTDNFDSAANKIYLNIDTGISSVKVSRY